MKDSGIQFENALKNHTHNILGYDHPLFVDELRSFFDGMSFGPIQDDIAKRFFRKNIGGWNRYAIIKDVPKSDMENHPIVESGRSRRGIMEICGGEDDLIEGAVKRFYDGTFNFCLRYGSQGVASVGFNPAAGGVVIKQIQGFKGAKEYMEPFKYTWTNLMTEVVVDWARKWNVPEVWINSVDENYYARKFYDNALRNDILRYFYGQNITFRMAKKMPVRRDLIDRFMDGPGIYEKSRLTPHQGFIIYDETARKCGFVKEGKNWVKKLR